MLKETASQIWAELDDAKPIHGCCRLFGGEGKQYCQRVSVTALRIARQVAFVDEMFQEKTTCPRAEQSSISHAPPPGAA